MPELVYKKSDQLSDEEKQQYCQLFHDVFHKTKSIKNFDQQFLNNHKGYGYHLFYICDTDSVGCTEYIYNTKGSISEITKPCRHFEDGTCIVILKSQFNFFFKELRLTIGREVV